MLASVVKAPLFGKWTRVEVGGSSRHPADGAPEGVLSLDPLRGPVRVDSTSAGGDASPGQVGKAALPPPEVEAVVVSSREGGSSSSRKEVEGPLSRLSPKHDGDDEVTVAVFFSGILFFSLFLTQFFTRSICVVACRYHAGATLG